MVSIKRIVVMLVTVGAVFGMAVPGPALATQQSGDQSPSDIPESQVFEVSDGGQIHAWERAGFTLRTDDTGAATQIPAPATVQGQTLGSGSFTSGNDGTDSKRLVQEFNGQRNPIGVHDSGESVTVRFDAGQASSGPTFDDLNNQNNVDLVAARLTPQDGKGVPTTTDDAFTLLSDIDNANENASFQMLKDGTSLDSSGQVSATQSYSPGHYVIFAAVHESGRNGFETTNGDISVDGDVTIIGMEQLAVQQGQTDVTEPDSPDPGNKLSFAVDASDAFDSGDDVTHAVAIYNKSTFEDARFDLVVDQSALGTNFDYSTDVELEHSINEVNGVADVAPGVTLNGNDLSDGTVRRPVGASSVVDFVADEAGVDSPQVNPITNGGESGGEYEQIDASVTAISGASPSATVTVDTFENFSEGSYQYVVVSTLDDNESQMSTTTGTIKLFNRTAEATVTSGQATTTFSGGSVESVGVSGLSGSVTKVTVSQSDSPTGGAPAPSGKKVATYLDISPDSPVNDDVEVTTTVPQSTLTNAGLGPSNATLLHYVDGSWTEVDTSASVSGKRVTLTGTASGLSPFAIGEKSSTNNNNNNNNGGGGGGVTYGTPPATINAPTSLTANGTTVATILGTNEDQTIVVNIPEGGNNSANGVTLQQVNFTSSTRAGYVRISVRGASEPSNNVPTLERGGSTLNYININTRGLPDAGNSAGSFKFTVSDQRLSELGVSPSNVVMYRYADGDWSAVETTHLGGNTYRANTPGFSWFAVGTSGPSVSVTDVSLSQTSVSAGESTTVSATIENTGDVEGDITLDLTADGNSVDSRTVTVGAGSTTTETFSLSRSQAGDYSVAVNGESAGTLTVSGESSPTEQSGGGSGEETSGGSGPGFTATAALLALVAAALLAHRRRS